eukprot:SAG25_NODE_1321_length_3292_cov_2.332289_2_plen_92_part_00
MPYTFNLSLAASNSSGALFNALIHNGHTHQVYEFGKIWTADPTELCKGRANCHIPPEGIDCARIKVSSGFFQEIYTGGQLYYYHLPHCGGT